MGMSSHTALFYNKKKHAFSRLKLKISDKSTALSIQASHFDIMKIMKPLQCAWMCPLCESTVQISPYSHFHYYTLCRAPQQVAHNFVSVVKHQDTRMWPAPSTPSPHCSTWQVGGVELVMTSCWLNSLIEWFRDYKVQITT